ncbi:ABC transporter substrate-binding protein [Actinoplanes derwentensis]|uniref:Monosaccharide ABC transporter substrate-binding protein, CUT2 family n=1 Tax=Actinoplanes derwentensis TaxID=113562 RepID=A0A1H2DBN7_9ACTN|nr:ABC transporter substrate-binding protein [Actinoplanes derwentensis]GID88533.1 LacI family transcriptional regulator [Actinoplanes derwentensis]SDT79997.1 monosaccharide ABC transporter substrate-binding protein, CUT2 family [Actinoplanes derwentensis]
MTSVAAGLGLALAGCGRDETGRIDLHNPPSGPIVLGFSQVGAESGWRLANTASIKKAAERNRVDLLFKDADGDQKRQLADIRSFIDARVTAIAFSPVVEKGYDDVLRQARDAKIPVILTDRLIETADPSLYISSIGAEFTSEGNLAAIYLENDYNGVDQTVNVVQILGTSGATPTKLRSEGFAATASRTGKLKIVASETGNWTVDGGEAAMRKLIRRVPRIDAVFAQNDDMGLGAVKALEAVGRKPGTDVRLVTVDATKKGLQSLAAGKLNYVVECSPLIGEQLMGVVVAIFLGARVEKRISSEKNVFDSDSAKDVLGDRPY